jgi:hypothetical protein
MYHSVAFLYAAQQMRSRWVTSVCFCLEQPFHSFLFFHYFRRLARLSLIDTGHVLNVVRMWAVCLRSGCVSPRRASSGCVRMSTGMAASMM